MHPQHLWITLLITLKKPFPKAARQGPGIYCQQIKQNIKHLILLYIFVLDFFNLTLKSHN